MTKHLTVTLMSLLLVVAVSQMASAQSDDWVQVSSANEQFYVRMPQSPTQARVEKSYGGLEVEGEVYRVVDNGVTYNFWTLVNKRYTSAQPPETEEFLDACADLVWESLLKPLRDKLPENRALAARMSYATELRGKRIPGREYSIKIERTVGTTNFYVNEDRIYILMTLSNTSPVMLTAERFFRSFRGANSTAEETSDRDSSNPTGIGVGQGTSNGPGRGGNYPLVRNPDVGDSAVADNDPNRVFSPREVAQKARILAKAEPQYTESARKYSVTGTVIIRAILSKEGAVENIKVMKGLPHGLTKTAILAAKGIRFEPAQKDGRPVSQYIQVEYNYNLY